MSVASWVSVAFGPHYSRLYRHRDEREARRIVAVVDALVPLKGRRILDLGCGAGRHLAPLFDRGGDVVGMDQSAVLLDEARPTARASGGAPLLRGDWGRLPFREGSFDVVLSLFTAFGYGDHPVAQQRQMTEIARVLGAGGSWLLDYLNPRRVRAELASSPPPRRRVLDGIVVEEHRRLNGSGDRVVKDVVIRSEAGATPPNALVEELRYQESVALIELEDLDDLAAGAAMSRVAAAGDYDGSAFDPDQAERWLLLYRRGEGT